MGTTVLLLLSCTHLYAQTSGSSISLQYGTVKGVEQVQAESRHAGGALLGGVAGAALAKDHRGLGALAGGLIGGGIEGRHTGKKVLQRYTVALAGGGALVIDTEQHDIRVDDCVVVEQGKYANIRRVSSVNCEQVQQPEHHGQAAKNCDKAKDELIAASSEEEVNIAVTKIRTLCED